MSTTSSLLNSVAPARRAVAEDFPVGVQAMRRQCPRHPWTSPPEGHVELGLRHEAALSGPVRLNAHGRSVLRTVRRSVPRDPLPLLGLQLRGWQGFGAGLRHGRGGLDVYFEGLHDRDRWQRDLARLPRDAAVVISGALAVGDRAFSAATVPDELGLIERWIQRDVDGSWWWPRVPAHGPLLEELLRCSWALDTAVRPAHRHEHEAAGRRCSPPTTMARAVPIQWDTQFLTR